jgi:hypothetical protein
MTTQITKSNHCLANIFSYLTMPEIIKFQQLNKKFYNKVAPRLLEKQDYQAALDLGKLIKMTDKSQVSIFRFGVTLKLNLNQVINGELEAKWAVEVPENYETARKLGINGVSLQLNGLLMLYFDAQLKTFA